MNLSWFWAFIITVVATGSTMGCKQKPQSTGPVVWFQIYLYVNGEYAGELKTGRAAVPSESSTLELLNDTIKTEFRVLEIDRKSVKFQIVRDGLVKVARTDHRHAASIEFESDGKNLTFSISAGGEIAPFADSDPSFDQEFSVFRVLPGWGEQHNEKNIRGREIVDAQAVNSAESIARFKEFMTDPEELSLGMGADCFDPHHAIRFAQNGDEFDVIICFQCGALRIYHGSPQNNRHEDYDEYVLRNPSALREFLAEYFPNDKKLRDRSRGQRKP